MEPLKTNIEEIIKLFIENNGKHILTQGTDIKDYQDNIDITNKYRNTVQLALGIHPTHYEEITLEKGITNNLYETAQKELNKYTEQFNKNKSIITAIGETGLDYYNLTLNKTYTQEQIEQIKEIQKLSLRKQLQIAKQNKLPLSIHARGNKEVIEDTLRLIAEEGQGTLTGSFHSYTGDIEQLQQILDIGFYIGFNAIITYKSGENVRQILKQTPLDKILFETDGPFLPPQSIRKNKKIKEKFAQPYNIKEIIQTAAQIKNIPPERLEQITDDNYEKVFC